MSVSRSPVEKANLGFRIVGRGFVGGTLVFDQIVGEVLDGFFLASRRSVS
jgi:hypothetical protein